MTNRGNTTKSPYDYAYHLIDPKEKTKEWALEYIQNKYPLLRNWGYFIGNDEYDFNLIRSYGRGSQPTSIYRAQFDPQGAADTNAGTKASAAANYYGLNWNIISVIPKYKRVVSAPLEKMEVKIQATAVDKIASNKREKDKELLLIQKDIDNMLAEISAKMGIKGKPIKSGIDKEMLNTPMSDAMSQLKDIEFNFDNDAELQLYMDTYYKQDVEIAQEILIQSILDLNEADEIKKLIIDDALDFGVAAIRTYMSNNTGLPRIEHLDIQKIKLGEAKRKDKKDANIWMYEYMFTINQLIEHFGNELSLEDVRELFRYGVQRYGYWNGSTLINNYEINWSKIKPIDFDRVRVRVEYFEFKSQNCETYEYSKAKYGVTKIKRRQYGYIPKDTEKKMKKEHWAEVVYKGYYIVGTNYICDYGMLENMVRKAGSEQLTQFSLHIYQFAEKSFVEQMIPHADAIQIAYLKLQHCLLKAKPSGYSFNIDALVGVALGSGGKIDEYELLRMYEQTGSTIHKTIDENGNPIMANSNTPHMRLDNGLGADIKGYLEIIAQHIGMIEQSIGYNPMMAGQLPEPRISAYSQKVATAAASNATYYLTAGLNNIIKNCATYISYLVQDMSRYKGAGWEALKNMVGNVNLSIIESMGNLHAHQFGITLQQQMTDEEKQVFQQFVMAAYEKGEIDLSDVIMVWFIGNYKQAIALFNLKRQKKIAQQMQAQQQAMQMQMKTQQDMMNLKAMIAQVEAQTKQNVADIQGQYQLELEKLKEQTKGNLKILDKDQKEELATHKTNEEIRKKRADALNTLLNE
jgi:hypothetical protein